MFTVESVKKSENLKEKNYLSSNHPEVTTVNILLCVFPVFMQTIQTLHFTKQKSFHTNGK